MEKKKWIKILFAFCMILILSPVSTVFADEISESADIISAPKAVSASDSRDRAESETNNRNYKY